MRINNNYFVDSIFCVIKDVTVLNEEVKKYILNNGRNMLHSHRPRYGNDLVSVIIVNRIADAKIY